MTAGDNSIDKDKLDSFIQQIFEIEDQRRELGNNTKELKREAKESGLDPQAIMVIVREKLRDADKTAKARALEETVDQYKAKLGILADLPLGRAAMERDGVRA